MDNKNDEIKNAIDDIFGDDTIEINSDISTNENNTSNQTNSNNNLAENNLFDHRNFNNIVNQENISNISEENNNELGSNFFNHQEFNNTQNVISNNENINNNVEKNVFNNENNNELGSNFFNHQEFNNTQNVISNNENINNSVEKDVFNNENNNELGSNFNDQEFSNTQNVISNNENIDNTLDDASKDVNDYKSELSTNKNDNNNNSNNNSFLKKSSILFILIVVAVLIICFVIFNLLVSKQTDVICNFTAEDTGYKVTDQYKITYKKDLILYVESEYNYLAKTDEYKSQISYIKKDKTPVIVNSNGMSGFTYLFEESDVSIKVNGYLDFEAFDYKKIKNINQDALPISYFKIDSKRSFKKLKKTLEDQGYVCTVNN